MEIKTKYDMNEKVIVLLEDDDSTFFFYEGEIHQICVKGLRCFIDGSRIATKTEYVVHTVAGNEVHNYGNEYIPESRIYKNIEDAKNKIFANIRCNSNKHKNNEPLLEKTPELSEAIEKDYEKQKLKLAWKITKKIFRGSGDDNSHNLEKKCPRCGMQSLWIHICNLNTPEKFEHYSKCSNCLYVSAISFLHYENQVRV